MRGPVGIAALLLAAVGEAQQTTGPSLSDLSRAPSRLSSNPLIADGDGFYLRRQEGRVGAKADVAPIGRAISFYQEAAQAPDSVEARWKLARALYFKGAYTGQGPENRRAIFEQARGISEEAMGILARRARRGAKGFENLGPPDLAALLRKDSDAAPSFFWSSVTWGEWSLSFGKLQAAKTGAASTIRDYAQTVVFLDPSFEEGGGYRILGRLHDQAPWIPFITGWVSRDEALRYLRLALQKGPRNSVNIHFLAECLWEGDAKQKTEAIALEERVLAQSPDPLHLVEDLKIQEDARRNLGAWKKAS